MSTKLQEAIKATRAGDKREAQLLLTELLKEDQEDAQAWFLLSNLVDSDSKKRAYLGKVLTLDPSHDRAQRQLAYIETTSADATAVADIPTKVSTDTPLDIDEDVADIVAAMSDAELTPTPLPPTDKEADEAEAMLADMLLASMDEDDIDTMLDDAEEEDTAVSLPDEDDTTITEDPTPIKEEKAAVTMDVAKVRAQYNLWIRLLLFTAVIIMALIAFYALR